MPPLRDAPRGHPACWPSTSSTSTPTANDKDVPRPLATRRWRCCSRYPWPGNVRELENAIERAVVLAASPTLGPLHFPTLRTVAPERSASAEGARGGVRIPGSTLAELEREAILRTLEAVEGSTSRAATILDISPRKIQYKLKEYHSAGAVAGCTPVPRSESRSGPPVL